MGAQWQFAVTDNGIGIAPEYKNVIFAIFQRLHTRGEYAGNGVGLAICNKIIEHYGGKIRVESEPGHSSTFCFTLPAVSADVKETDDRLQT
jgi:light-regulated signal transduction histidine kinase (bacteriophytochrome)